MTIGAIRREARDMSHDMRSLTMRVDTLEFNAKRAFKRHLAWSISAAVVSSALIWFVAR